MRPENKKFLDDNRHHYDLLVKAQVVKHLDMATRTNLLKVIHEEFNPAYLGQLWCQSCVADMISFAYTQYDKVGGALEATSPQPEKKITRRAGRQRR